MTHRREAIDRGHSQLSINRQRDLLGLSKNALYYRPILESPYNLELMDLIDKKYLVFRRIDFYTFLTRLA